MKELDKLVAYARTKYPCVMVVGSEPDRVVSSLYGLTKNGEGKLTTQSGQSWQIWTWDIRRKLRWEGHGQIKAQDIQQVIGDDNAEEFAPPNPPLDAITYMAKAEPYRIYCLYNFHPYLEDQEVIQEIQNSLAAFKDKSVMLVFMVPSEKIPPELEHAIQIVDWPLPTKEEIRQVLEKAEKDNQQTASNPEAVIDSASGLPLQAVQDAMSMAFYVTKGKDYDPKVIWNLKAQMIRKTAGLYLANYPTTFTDIIELDLLKEFFTNRFYIWNDNRHLPFKGAIITGFPGNAKTMFLQALSNEVGWPCVFWNIGETLDKYVGESPKKARAVFKTCRAMGHIILCINELEKGLGGVGKETGTAVYDEIGNVILEELDIYDPEHPVITVCTSNNISILPPEYVRLGRFDGIFFVENPSEAGAKQILDMYLKEFTGQGVDKHFQVTLGGDYSGAEVRQIALETAYNGGNLEQAVQFVQPIARVRKNQYAKMRQTALESAARAASKHQLEFVGDYKRKVELS